MYAAYDLIPHLIQAAGLMEIPEIPSNGYNILLAIEGLEYKEGRFIIHILQIMPILFHFSSLVLLKICLLINLCRSISFVNKLCSNNCLIFLKGPVGQNP